MCVRARNPPQRKTLKGRVMPISILPPSFIEPPQPAPPDKFELALAEVKNNPNAVLQLNAPRRLWKKDIDWVLGPLPCGLQINYIGRKIKTPLVQRCLYQQKKICKKMSRGRCPNFNLGEIVAVTILRGELSNEAVSRG